MNEKTKLPSYPAGCVTQGIIVLRISVLSVFLLIGVRGFNWLSVPMALQEHSLTKVEVHVNSTFNVFLWKKYETLCSHRKSLLIGGGTPTRE